MRAYFRPPDSAKRRFASAPSVTHAKSSVYFSFLTNLPIADLHVAFRCVDDGNVYNTMYYIAWLIKMRF